MRQQRVVICGLARNIADVLPATIERIDALAGRFDDCRVVVYENDSVDATRSLLFQWQTRDSRVHLVAEDRQDPVNPVARCLQRASRMAAYRNRCLDEIRRRWSDFDAVIVVDLDLRNGFSVKGIANTFGHDGWDFVGSNGVILKRIRATLDVPVQYDAWAFRRHGDFTALSTAAVNAMRFRVGDPLVPVASCFGGLGVYRMPAFLSSRYDGSDSEHVPFHRGLLEAGFTGLFLNPSQVTCYGRRRRKSDWWAMPCVQALTACGRWFRGTMAHAAPAVPPALPQPEFGAIAVAR